MFRNYLKIAWRNLLKFRVFSFINILGLALSMSVCMIIINLIVSQFRYDDFHPNEERIYRIISTQAGFNNPFYGSYATSPINFGEELYNSQTGVEKYSNISKTLRGELTSPEKILDVEGLYADEHFFNVFGFELVQGDPASALSNTNSIVLDEAYAQKLFPDSDPIGQLVSFNEIGSYQVTGISKTPPSQSHIKFDALASMSSLKAHVKNGKMNDIFDWNNQWSSYNYVLLKNDSYVEEVESRIAALADENIEPSENKVSYIYTLQNLDSIVPGPIMANEISFTLPWYFTAVLALLGLIVIVTASINYANLSIAKSLGRTKEIGIRKVNGARRGQIMYQFLIESVMISLLSLAGAVFMYRYLLTQFNELWIFNTIGVELVDDPFNYLYFFVFSFLLGIATGIVPALFSSKINIVKAIKGSGVDRKTRTGLSRYFSRKKTLVGVQYGFAVFILLSIFILKIQGDYLVNAKYGFNEDEVFNVDIQNNDPQRLKTEFLSMPMVKGATFASHHPAVGRSYGAAVKRKWTDPDFTSLYHFSVDDNYIDVMDLDLIAGNNFPENISSENEKFIILNETAVKRLNFENPSDAISSTIIFDDSLRLQVVGIVRDYHWEHFMTPIKALGLRYRPEQFQHAYFKVSPGRVANTYKVFKNQWNEFDPGREFSGGFLNEELDMFYQFFFDLRGILMIVGLMAVVITGLGFMGMIGYELKSRVKEIGIRKVLGATASSIGVSITRGFLISFLVALLIAGPLTILLHGQWVYMMAKHAPIGISSILPTLVLLTGLTATIIIYQVVKSMRENPIDALRSE